MMFSRLCPRCGNRLWYAPWVTWILCSCGHTLTSAEVIDTEERLRPENIRKMFRKLEETTVDENRESGKPTGKPTGVNADSGKAADGMGDSTPRIWSCKIGETRGSLPPGADAPMREAVREAYWKLTGAEPNFIFSGWCAELDETEREIVTVEDQAG